MHSLCLETEPIKELTTSCISHLIKYKQQNPKNEPYNMLPKLTQTTQIKG